MRLDQRSSTFQYAGARLSLSQSMTAPTLRKKASEKTPVVWITHTQRSVRLSPASSWAKRQDNPVSWMIQLSRGPSSFLSTQLQLCGLTGFVVTEFISCPLCCLEQTEIQTVSCSLRTRSTEFHAMVNLLSGSIITSGIVAASTGTFIEICVKLLRVLRACLCRDGEEQWW